MQLTDTEMFLSDKTGDMNLSLVSSTKKQALYLAQRGRLIKSKHCEAFFYTKPALCQTCFNSVQPQAGMISFLKSYIDLNVALGQKSYLSIQGDRHT